MNDPEIQRLRERCLEAIRRYGAAQTTDGKLTAYKDWQMEADRLDRAKQQNQKET